MRVVALNGIDPKNKKIAETRMMQNSNVLLIDVKVLMALGEEKNKLENLTNFRKILEVSHKDEEYVSFIISNKEEEKYLINLLGDNLEVCDVSIANNDPIRLIYEIDSMFSSKKSYTGEIKTPNDFNNVPLEYKETVSQLYDEFSKIDNKAMLLLVTGSVNRGCVYDKWSDIDLIIVLRDGNNQEARNEISRIVNKCKVKVGTTVYSKEEFESLLVDYKTMAAIYDINRGAYKPTIIDSELKIPMVTREDIITRAYQLIPDMLHSMRRFTYTSAKVDYIKLFKDLSHFMRTLDWANDVYPMDYQDVAEKFFQIYGNVEYTPNDFLRSHVTGENVDEQNEILLNATRKFLDFCPSKLLIGDGKNVCKVRKLQNK